MNRYVKLLWVHPQNENEPYLFYFELDEEGDDIRKLEI